MSRNILVVATVAIGFTLSMAGDANARRFRRFRNVRYTPVRRTVPVHQTHVQQVLPKTGAATAKPAVASEQPATGRIELASHTPASPTQPKVKTSEPVTLAVHQSSASAPQSSAQAVAQARANYMAKHGYANHPPISAGNWVAVGGRFEGVGWHSSPNAEHSQIPTCMTHGTPIADAVARGPSGSYRVRIW